MIVFTFVASFTKFWIQLMFKCVNYMRKKAIWSQWNKQKYWKSGQKCCWLICWLFYNKFFCVQSRLTWNLNQFLPFNPFFTRIVSEPLTCSYRLTLCVHIFRPFLYTRFRLFAFRIHLIPVLNAEQHNANKFCDGRERFLVNILYDKSKSTQRQCYNMQYSSEWLLVCLLNFVVNHW